MAIQFQDPAPKRHPRLPENTAGKQAKADLRLPERQLVGRAIEGIRLLAKLSLKEFAAQLGRDERQVARWITGEERPQFDAILAVLAFRPLVVIAFAKVAAGERIEVVTEIRVRESA